jgi:Aminoglycoside-2''-adenylyltransferase
VVADGLGPWEPLDLSAAVAIFTVFPGRWWIGGGYALELHVGRSWRTHDDLDVGVLRTDVPYLRSLLPDWDIRVASAGVLSPWEGTVPRVEQSQNNLWCRRNVEGPWCLDVTVGDGDHERWVFRRKPTIRFPWKEAVLRTEQGVPYIAPELQLLFKSRDCRPKDDRDAAEVIPALTLDRRDRLRDLLREDHHWQVLLTE